MIDNIPITHRETHGIANENHSHQSITGDFLVAVDGVTYRQLAADRNAATQHTHGECQPNPMNLVGGADTPKEESRRNEDQEDGLQP